MSIFKKTDYIYTSLFCEENIWKLCEALYMNGLAKPIDVLFIINFNNTIAIFEQQQSINSTPMIWDYHVVLCADIDGEKFIFDFDSRCDFPINIHTYFSKTFKNHNILKDNYKPLIKAINPQHYIQHFYSNRQHMSGIIEQNKFPDYPLIIPSENMDHLTLDQCQDINHTNLNRCVISPNDYLINL